GLHRGGRSRVLVRFGSLGGGGESSRLAREAAEAGRGPVAEGDGAEDGVRAHRAEVAAVRGGGAVVAQEEVLAILEPVDAAVLLERRLASGVRLVQQTSVHLHAASADAE